MTRYKKDNKGMYLINGHKFKKLEGSRAEVWHGTAYKTSGELTKKDFIKNKHGEIVSKSKHLSAKKEKRLVKAGYGTVKGRFGAVRLSHMGKKSRRRGRKMRGGSVKAFNDGGVSTNGFSSVPANVTDFSNLTTYN